MPVFQNLWVPGFSAVVPPRRRLVWTMVRSGVYDIRRFMDGEIFFQILENVRGADVFVVQPCSHPTDFLPGARSVVSFASMAFYK